MKTKPFLFVISVVVLSISAPARQPGGSGLYDPQAQKAARKMLSEGDVPGALSGFKSMLDLNAKEIWTAQALLVCEANDLDSRASALEEASSEPVIVIKRVIDSKTCFRVCAGLFGSRQEAAALTQSLPSPFREAKPYPLLLAKNGVHSSGAFVDDQAPAVTQVPAPPEKPSRDDAGAQGAAAPASVSAPSGPLQATDEAQDLFNRGLEAFNRNDLRQAESFFKRSVELAPDRFESVNNLGAVLLHQKKYSEAKDVLEKAVQLKPGYPNAHSNLGGAYWFLGKRQEAISEAQKAFRLDSHNVRYCTNLASFLYEEKRYSDAQIYLNVVKIIDPENEDALAIQKKIDDSMGKTGPSPVVAVDTPPLASASVAGGDESGQADAEDTGKPEKKKREKKQKDEAGEKNEESGPDPGDKPKKSFWDRFRKNSTDKDAAGARDDSPAGGGPTE